MLQEKEKYLINNSLTKGDILSGVICAVEPVTIEDKTMDSCVILYGNTKIIIPSVETGVFLFKDQQFKKTNRDPLGIFIKELIGAEVDFIIKSYDEKSEIAIASRFEAMEKKKSDAKIKLNAKVDARIVSVLPRYAIVEYSGIQAAIPFQEISWGRIYDAKDYCKVGETQKAVIKSIKEDGEIEFSLRLAKSEPYEELIIKKGFYKEGGEYIAEVREIKNEGIFLELTQGITVMCYHPEWMGYNPKIGSKYTVIIKKFKNDVRYIDGSLVKPI